MHPARAARYAQVEKLLVERNSQRSTAAGARRYPTLVVFLRESLLALTDAVVELFD